MLLVGVVLAVAIAVTFLLFILGGAQEVSPPVTSGGLVLVPVFAAEGPGVRSAVPRFNRPMGVAVGEDGRVFVADSGNNRICVFGPDGGFEREWGAFGMAKPLEGIEPTWKPGSLNFPVGIDVGDDGLVYVADFRNDQLSVFTQSGEFVRAFPDPAAVVGRGGSGQDGRGIAVTDVEVSDGRVFATDTYQIFEFTPEGGFVRQFGRPGTGLTDIDHPAGVATLDSGTLIVSDSNHTRLVAFEPEGLPLWEVTQWSTEEQEPPASQFGLPRGLTVTDDGLVIVADAVAQALVVLDGKGRTVATLGSRGTGIGDFNFPTDVCSAGELVAVADKENGRIQVFRLDDQRAEKMSSERREARAGGG